MTFDEMCLSVDAISNSFDIALERCELFAEASYNEYITNLQEAELKVIKESGTKEDADSLKGAASEGFIVRAQKTIQKIIDAFIQAMKALGNNISAFFSKAENASTLKKIEKKAKEDQTFGSKQIETGDPKAFETAENKINAIFQKVYAKGRGKKVSSEEVNQAVEEAKAESNKAVKATIIVSVAAALAYITSHGKAKESDYEKRARILFNHETKNIAESDAEQLSNITKAITNHTKIQKQLAVEKFKRCVTAPFTKIKSMVTGSGELPLPKGVKESTMDSELESILDSVFEQVEMESEVQDMSIESVLDEIEKEINEEVTEKSEVEEELDIIESALFGDEADNESSEECSEAVKELEVIESALFGDEYDYNDDDGDDDDEYSEAAAELDIIEEALFSESSDPDDESVEDILNDIESMLY